MIADREGNRKTATAVANDIMEAAAYGPVEVWAESWSIDASRLTDRERQQVERQIYKRYARIRKLLGFPPL